MPGAHVVVNGGAGADRPCRTALAARPFDLELGLTSLLPFEIRRIPELNRNDVQQFSVKVDAVLDRQVRDVNAKNCSQSTQLR